MDKIHSEWLLHSSQYLGEISALCFLHLPYHFHSLPYLLAGSGSQVLLYDLEAAKLKKSFQVFEGIRLHGITCNEEGPGSGSVSTTAAFKVALYGEKKVKLFDLIFDLSRKFQNQPEVHVNWSFVQSLPRFSHWVLDVSFLKDCEGSHCLAIGCSDNSIRVWNISNSTVILQVQSPEKCLLYSMRLWGDNLEALRIASGTIYNEIIVWKVDSQYGAPLLTGEEDHTNMCSSASECVKVHHQQYKVVNMFRLIGHEGSIFRIEWSSSGSKLVSVSDDRSARIWAVDTEQRVSDSIEVVSSVLYGHNARVWDCCLTDSIIITAGEDCTCRVWGTDGKQLKMIKEHVGRGIWRCLYDPISSLLVTAGFDSAIKVHELCASLSRSLQAHPEAKEFNDRTEVFNVKIPNLSEHTVFMDSKSEYVRCLCFTRKDSLYVATNHGYLYHAKLSSTSNVKWTKLVQFSEGVPIICMDLLSNNVPEDPCGIDDWVALGDGKGNMTVVGVVGDVSAPESGFTFTWSAGIERQLLGTYWCRSLGYRFVFTADPRGILKLWQLHDPSLSVHGEPSRTNNVSLVAEFSSCFGVRIMCLDASFENEVLVCGDLRGNLILFPLSREQLLGTSAASDGKISPLNYFKGAHGISTVSSISVARLSSNQIEIRSTGGDGCICYLDYGSDEEKLEFIGMKQVKELSLIQSVSYDNNSDDDLASCNYAAGFASADFIIWNLITEAKVMQIPCGGWRRPHSYLLGDIPEIKNCFAYVKDEVIYIHRHWIPKTEKKMFPQNLHMQFHGREIHTLSFVSENLQVGANGKKSPSDKSSWIATGCEDGTVRLTRYSPGVENWSASKLLGEHVGGSAVKSICCASEIHVIYSVVNSIHEKINRQKADSEDKENPFLLISVGAKRVLTSWLLRNRKMDKVNETPEGQNHDRDGNGYDPSVRESSSLSFQWLSTDMPTKNSSIHGKTKEIEKMVGIARNVASVNSDANTESNFVESRETYSKSRLEVIYEDDWRYLAVTAFLVKLSGSRLTVCFVVVACSDATLAVRALILPHRLWFDVALLVPMSSPVLALQHVIVPVHLPSKDDVQIGSAYFVVSGATDGSIALWDLTESVEAFMRQLSTLHLEKLIDCQKRPRTGRGSQGGRWWRTLSSARPKKKPGSNSSTLNDGEGADCNIPDHTKCGSSTKSNDKESSTVQLTDNAFEPGSITVDFGSEICEIQPIHVLKNAHQSGVNCLHVSEIRNCQNTDYGKQFSIVSGGDDQAIHCFGFDLSMPSSDPYSKIITPAVIKPITESENVKKLIYFGPKQNQYYGIRLFNHYRVSSAHSSAIKGIWTDGIWVFSTGLDQRVRCWILEEHGKLTEHAHLVISVPEPEALDARACSRNHYQIAVAGRGMQMVEFSATHDVDGTKFVA
ncbi:hypothetical protein Dsin_025693 [Dipteronia sinensis]|uniref:WD repeat-containing protein 6 n=1 Tax=Dipteronia sinensis TaxID=43782 RepID=A0AAD9ZXW6_9ROSI|nr:hypothetical protein Dsin_025693 [Dipteronia sinensis]